MFFTQQKQISGWHHTGSHSKGIWHPLQLWPAEATACSPEVCWRGDPWPFSHTEGSAGAVTEHPGQNKGKWSQVAWSKWCLFAYFFLHHSCGTTEHTDFKNKIRDIGVGDMTKIVYHDNNIYHGIVISFKKVFVILKSLIPYNFHNPCHQCQYKTNTSLKREREKITQPHWR